MSSPQIRPARPEDADAIARAAPPVRVPLFVYGTLKQGFPNFARNPGRCIGVFRTRQAYPLHVVQLGNEDRAPWLVDSPGQGHAVLGEVFEVDAAQLAALDAFEEVGLACGYRRAGIVLEAVDAPHGLLHAQAYFKTAQQLAAEPLCEGPFPEYTAALAAGYRIDLG